jgi:hypothetical protein
MRDHAGGVVRDALAHPQGREETTSAELIPADLEFLFSRWIVRVGYQDACEILRRAMNDLSGNQVLEDLAYKNRKEREL